MLFVLDETFGFEQQYFEEKILVRQITRRDQGKNKRRQLISAYTMSEHLEFFTSIPSNESLIIYFYDPVLTDQSTLQRVRNWLLPKYSLVAIRIINRAEIACFIDEITRLEEKSNIIGSHQIITLINKIRINCQQYIVAPDPLALLSKKKLSKNFNNKRHNLYQMCLVQDNGLKKLRTKGSITTIWNSLDYSASKETRLWIVEKGTGLELPHDCQTYKLDSSVLPNNMPFIHAMIVSALN